MNRTRVFSAIFAALFVVLTSVSGYAEQATSEHLTRAQLKSLIATAKTPAEHERIAHYYETQAQDYLAQSQKHETMLASFKANSVLTTEKTRYGTVKHCEYLVKSLKDRAAKAEMLAQMHEKMAREAGQK